MKLLIVYGTTDGMTARIAEHMAGVARGAGHAAIAVRADRRAGRIDLGDFDAVIVGASLHAGGFQRPVARFVRTHHEELRRLPTAFFAVNMSIASRFPEDREKGRSIAAAFPAKLAWIPDRFEVFAGALMFSRYGFLRRAVMKSIARKEVGDVDVTKDHVYTDWAAVEHFVVELLAHAEAQRRPAHEMHDAGA